MNENTFKEIFAEIMRQDYNRKLTEEMLDVMWTKYCRGIMPNSPQLEAAMRVLINCYG